ncbi:MAG TPA: hypothetical protein VJQ45_01260 [Ktedonobacterales bacterium]|nr:hypothetical protein [Ktedonobacterales bacterium]
MMHTPPPPGDGPTLPGGEPRASNPPVPPAHPQPMPPISPEPYPSAYGPPPYAPYPPQPAYPPYPAYAPYGQPPQPPRSSNRGLWIGLSILGVVILLSCVACAVGVGLLINNASRTLTSTLGPAVVAEELCGDEENSDYVAVYDLFSSNLQSQTTQDDFVAASQAREQAKGVVRDCTAAPASQVTGESARVQITLTLDDGQHNGYITLVQQGGLWQIDSYDSSLGLT